MYLDESVIKLALAKNKEAVCPRVNKETKTSTRLQFKKEYAATKTTKKSTWS